MIKLWNHGLLDARTVNNCNIILEQCKNKENDPKASSKGGDQFFITGAWLVFFAIEISMDGYEQPIEVKGILYPLQLSTDIRS